MSGRPGGDRGALGGTTIPLDIGTPTGVRKTGVDRVVPITSRLKAVLTMHRQDPEGDDLPPDAYVFGDEAGGPVKSIKTAWKLTCQRAAITDLHFHDLRRECGSRLLETSGGNVADVRDWLGHTTIATTNKYLSGTIARLQETRKRFERAQRQKTRRAEKSRSRRTSVAHHPETTANPAGSALSAEPANALTH